MASRSQLVENEIVFREVNERIKAIDDDLRLGAPDFSTDGIGEFFCECGDAGCTVKIAMTTAEYEHVRSNPTHFALAIGHSTPEIERVVSENDRFAVAEKQAGAGRLAAEHDPRS